MESTEPTIGSDSFALVAVLSLQAGEASDDVLNVIDPHRRLDPVITYTVHEQFYFLLLHVALRLAFTLGGPNGRDFVQDSISPKFLFNPIVHYLNRRYNPQKMSDAFIQELEEQFLDRLNQSENEYSRELEYIKKPQQWRRLLGAKQRFSIQEGMKDQAAGRLYAALSHAGVTLDSNFTRLIKETVNRRVADVSPIAALVLNIIRGDLR